MFPVIEIRTLPLKNPSCAPVTDNIFIYDINYFNKKFLSDICLATLFQFLNFITAKKT